MAVLFSMGLSIASGSEDLFLPFLSTDLSYTYIIIIFSHGNTANPMYSMWAVR
jgi:hypothetical protein